MEESTDDNYKASPKDVFLHLLSIGTLYFSAGAFLHLVFTLINIWLPDNLNQFYDPGNSLRWSISLLVVLFPVYLWTVKTLHGEMLEHVAKRKYRIRKWLIYFTMFAAAAFILGDMVALINTYLGGDLTLRFILKAVAVLFVAGSVLGYYRLEVKEDVEEIVKYSKKIGWVVGTVVLAFVIAGFIVAGSPGQQRAVKYDSQRAQNLSEIQYQLLDYWRAKDEIPEDLSAVKSLAGSKVLLDPQTDEPYEYEKLGNLSFELCATFEESSEDMVGPEVPRPLYPREGGISNDWTHAQGRYCFERTIDPDFYQ